MPSLSLLHEGVKKKDFFFVKVTGEQKQTSIGTTCGVLLVSNSPSLNV